MAQYRLAYETKEELARDTKLTTLRVRDRVSVKLSDSTRYVFTYMGTVGDQVTGLSALNGRQVILDPDQMSLTEA